LGNIKVDLKEIRWEHVHWSMFLTRGYEWRSCEHGNEHFMS